MALDQKYPYHSISVDETLEKLQVTKEGLTDEEAKKRLHDVGPNELTGTEGINPVLLFLKQFKDFLILILFLAAGVAWYADQRVDVYVILGVILFNAILGFLQEYRAEKAILALKRMIKQETTVVRNNKARTVEAKELVPGDIIRLEEGDSIPADARLLTSKNLQTVEASLTGESLPIEKKTEPLPEKSNLGDRLNMLFKGTHVARGTATAAVTGTGNNTELGKISKSLSDIKTTSTNFRKKTERLAKQMAVIAIATSVVVFILGYYVRDYAFEEVLLITVATLVSSIPEGLPAVISIVLAIGAKRMANQNAIIREFTATEMLGSVSVILTDKTGTLTKSILTVKRIFLGNGKELEVSGTGYAVEGDITLDEEPVHVADDPVLAKLLFVAEACNNARLLDGEEQKENNNSGDADKATGDPTEIALLVLAKKAEARNEDIFPEANRLDDLPFSSEQKYRATLVDGENGKELLAVGAPEKILELSSGILNAEGPQQLTDELRQQIKDKLDDWADHAMRVLALAYKDVETGTNTINADQVKDLTWVGITGIVDPPRRGVQEAVGACKSAGIRVMMLTGDHKKTGAAIAREVGILEGEHVNGNYPDALQEDELEEEESRFDELVDNVSVFTRVSPNTKLRIAEHLQDKGYLIAMTGDGVNDAPALKRADVGIAMGIRGTDVAKDASHIVLSDDNFATIVRAIREGRIVFQNVRQTSFFLLTTNFAFVFVFIVAIALGWPFPLTATQILWVNLVTDGVMELGLAAERGHGEIMKQKPVARDANILDKSVVPYLLLMGTVMLGLSLAVFSYYLPTGEEMARTAVFIVIAMTQVFNTYNMRSIDRSLFTIGVLSNKYVNIAFVVSLALQLLVVYTPFLNNIFRFDALPLPDLLIILLLSSSVIWFAEAYKKLRFGSQPADAEEEEEWMKDKPQENEKV
ncbi:cation-translocating P-type ATPase [Pontibacter cellulosilyticus]|uniref:HAD-IC family P-type ATPase n=1 Tax=Pontibacter cellulosilyticus TaxID=1720253 RepID=A0A923SHA4_9BACT|nr:HAD-IC family P-type ATPase [Pontibacter cellulosilyticus]MBC5991342.1 HAD-IC family P-type ATPase [Pontibacter cellulosilyticus]